MTTAILGSVGAGGLNRRGDVLTIQRLMQQAQATLAQPSVHPGDDDGRVGDGVVSAVEAFQRDHCFMRRPDGRIDAGGMTWRRLVAAVEIGYVDGRYPMGSLPKRSWMFDTGMRAFGASRSGGARRHAGADCYDDDGAPVYAVAPGVVLGVNGYYMKTGVVTVDHGPFIARYGEVEKRYLVRAGERVTKGQLIGRVGVLRYEKGRRKGQRLGVPSMMCHFEMYDKTASGAYLQRVRTARDLSGRPFVRRRDLIDPTPHLHRWTAQMPS